MLTHKHKTSLDRNKHSSLLFRLESKKGFVIFAPGVFEFIYISDPSVPCHFAECHFAECCGTLQRVKVFFSCLQEGIKHFRSFRNVFAIPLSFVDLSGVKVIKLFKFVTNAPNE